MAYLTKIARDIAVYTVYFLLLAYDIAKQVLHLYWSDTPAATQQDSYRFLSLLENQEYMNKCDKAITQNLILNTKLKKLEQRLRIIEEIIYSSNIIKKRLNGRCDIENLNFQAVPDESVAKLIAGIDEQQENRRHFMNRKK